MYNLIPFFYNIILNLLKVMSTYKLLYKLTMIFKKCIIIQEVHMKRANETIYKYILEQLKIGKNKDNDSSKIISGASLAKNLHISRSYVSKVIAKLIEKGYEIKKVDRMGYIYQSDIKVLDEKYIKTHIIKQKNVQILDSVDSTNNYLKKIQKNEKLEEMIVIADAQTAGRGRLGRTFISNYAKGIYMSILFKPTFSLAYAKKITCLVAAATSLAIDQIAGVKTQIKWVNDIYLNSKKICGILTEAATSIEQDSLEYVIIGIGINMYYQNFDEKLQNIATSIEEQTNKIISRNELIVQIINQIDAYLDHIDDDIYMDEYIKKSFVIGKTVELYKNNQTFIAKVININKEGELEVFIDGRKQKISTGEITRMSVRYE